MLVGAGIVAYLAVRSTDPVTRDFLAYGLRHGGTVGRNMTVPFVGRPQLTLPSRGTSCCQAFRPPLWWDTGIFCTICREPDHFAHQCALAPVQQPLLLAPNPGFPSSQPPLPANSMTAPCRVIGPPRRPETLFNICALWNCAFPGTCTYRHVCGNCQFGHRVIKCPQHQSGPSTIASDQPALLLPTTTPANPPGNTAS